MTSPPSQSFSAFPEEPPFDAGVRGRRWRDGTLWVVAGLFVLASLWLGVVGTGTLLYYQLPALAALGCALILGSACAKPSAFVWSRLAVLSVVVMVGYVLVRALQSPIPYSARRDEWLLLGCAAVYVLFVFVLHGTSARTMVVAMSGLLGVANTLIALYQRLVDPHFDVIHEHDASRPIPGSGLYFNYDHMAGFAELAALLCLSMALLGKGERGMRLFFGSLGLISCLGVLVSMSRGGFLSLGAGLATLGVIVWLASGRFRWSPAARKTVLVLGILALIGFSGAGFHLLGKRFANAAESGPESDMFRSGLSNRLENWDLALRQWRLAPLVGTGSGTYDEYSIKLWRADWHRPDRALHPVHAHNDYLQMLAEYGMIGLGCVLLVLVLHLCRGITVIRRWLRSGGSTAPEGNTRIALACGALCCLVAYSLHSAIDFNLRLFASASLIAFCFAVLASAGPRKANPGARERSAGVGRLTGAVLGLWLLTVSIRASVPEYHFEKLRQALKADEIEAALSHGSSAEKREKKNDVLYRLLGYARMEYAERFDLPAIKRGFLRNAISALETAVTLNPGDSHSHVLLGRCLDQTGDRDGAELAYRKGLEWDPYGVETNGAYGELLLEMGIRALTVGEHKRSMKSLETARGHLELAYYGTEPKEDRRKEVWSQCLDALHQVHSETGRQLDQEAQRAEEAGETARAREKYLEAMDAYQISLSFKPSGSPETASAVRRYHEIKSIVFSAKDGEEGSR